MQTPEAQLNSKKNARAGSAGADQFNGF